RPMVRFSRKTGDGGPDFEAPTKVVHRGPVFASRAGNSVDSVRPVTQTLGQKNNGLGEAMPGQHQPRRITAARWSREPLAPSIPPPPQRFSPEDGGEGGRSQFHKS